VLGLGLDCRLCRERRVPAVGCTLPAGPDRLHLLSELVAVEQLPEFPAAARRRLLGDADALGPAGEFDELVRAAEVLVGPLFHPETGRSRSRVGLLDLEAAAEYPLAVPLDDHEVVVTRRVEEEGADCRDLP